MSLVARIAIDDYALLVGDLLLSSLEDPDQPLIVPTVGDIRKVFPVGSGFVPSGLCQKISIIGDNVAIGWAGSKIAARIVIMVSFGRIHNDHSPMTA